MATIQQLFKSRLKQYANEPLAALYAYRVAKADLARGRPTVDWSTHVAPKGHGDVLRMRGADGKKRTFVIVFRRDDTMGEPWNVNDGHGVVSEYTTRDKAPGEVEIARDRGGKRFYHVQESIQIAKRDSWGLSPDDLATLATEKGREPSKGEIAATAVANDCERMRRWCNDQWEWIGVCLVELDPDAIEYPENVADDQGRDLAAALWGIESDSEPAYLESVAYELLSETR